jgi:hypothetical protein
MSEKGDRIDRFVSKVKKEGGCVPRAIGSAVGVEPPEYAYLLRALDLYDIGKSEDWRQIEDPTEQLAALRNVVERDQRSIRRLINRLEKDNGPFGEALRQFSVRREVLSEEQIRRRIVAGNEVLVGGPGRASRRSRVRFHRDHVGIAADGNLISLSEPARHIIELPPGQKVNAVVFRKKKPQ